MKKIEIKLKECCLTCKHFDPSGIVGIAPSVFCCGEPDRIIACGHMDVCCKYKGCEPVSAIRCGECMRWVPDGTYGLEIDGTKRQYGVCSITNTACKENHFCGFGKKRK